MSFSPTRFISMGASVDSSVEVLALLFPEGEFEKYHSGGAVDIPASTKVTLYDVADDMSLPVSFYCAAVVNKSTDRTLWVFRYCDPGGNETSWPEPVPPNSFTLIYGDTLDSAFAGEVSSITGQDLPNSTVAKIEAFNPSGGLGQAEIILFAEKI